MPAPATNSVAREALDAAVTALAAAGVETPRLDAEVLLAAATGRDRAALLADPGAAIEPAAGRRFGEWVRRRLRREPVAYILGRQAFRRIELEVDRRVLIPRPETELLVEVALELGPRRVLDVGTGSGAIALAVADELPDCVVVAVDTSAGALAVARANAERLGLGERVTFVPGAWGDADPSAFDLVLANLPYVAERDWASLEPEVTDWEPREALLAGPDGLDAYRAFFSSAVVLSQPSRDEGRPRSGAASRLGSAAVAVEVGEGQASEVGELARSAGFEEIEIRRDLAGIERVVIARPGRGGDASASVDTGPEAP